MFIYIYMKLMQYLFFPFQLFNLKDTISLMILFIDIIFIYMFKNLLYHRIIGFSDNWNANWRNCKHFDYFAELECGSRKC